MLIKEAIYLITSVIALENALYIFYLNRRSATNIVYTLFALDFAVCSFVLYKITGAPDLISCKWWFNFNALFGCSLASLALHFAVLVTGLRRRFRLWILALFYLPCIFFTFLWLNTGYFHSEFYLTEYGWDTSMNPASFKEYLFITYFNIAVITGTIIIIKWRLTEKRPIESKQAASITFPFIAGSACVMLCPYFINLHDMGLFNQILDVTGQFMFIYFLTGIRYSVGRYNLMKVSSETPAWKIISGFYEPAFLLNTDREIITYNEKAGESFGLSSKKQNRSVADIFSLQYPVKSIINDIYTGRKQKCEISCTVPASREKLKTYKLKMHAIYNEESIVSGILVLAETDHNLHDFKQKFRITDRQFEIVFMVISGLPNREIAEKLGITEKTVENHMVNIYNKLGIYNKIELLNLSRLYNILSN